MRRFFLSVSLVAFALAALTACQSEPAEPAATADPAPSDTLVIAQANLEPTDPEGAYFDEDANGASGVVMLEEQPDGSVEVTYDIRGLTPGLHGFHVHENGDCAPGEDGTPGGAAGGHFSPMGDPHGAPNSPAGQRHVGDLGNIEAGEDGVATGTFMDDRLAFDGPANILGKAMLVHAEADDLTSQPSGAAGGRVACGVIVTDASGQAIDL